MQSKRDTRFFIFFGRVICLAALALAFARDAYVVPLNPVTAGSLVVNQVGYLTGWPKRALVIGAETLSRVTDPHDRDTMIYADGAGACVLEGVESELPIGIMAHSSRSDTYQHAHLLRMDRSYNPAFNGSDLFLKMKGHKLYEYALRFVPRVVKECVTNAGLTLRDISKVLIHQANAKMDEAILDRIAAHQWDGTTAGRVGPLAAPRLSVVCPPSPEPITADPAPRRAG